MRHRASIQDLGLVLAVVLVAGFLFLEIEIFVHEDTATDAEKTLALNEVMILGTLLSLGMLLFSWRRLREQKSETRRRAAAEQEARQLASQDVLTGLPNRRKFNDCLSAAIQAPPGSGAAHALIMLDLNGFKQVNDVHGHGAGDEVLILVAQRLQKAAREGDLIARLGGDEFAIVSQHLAGPEAATGIALRVIDALTSPVVIKGVRHQVGAALGVCMFPFEGADAQEVMRRADVALYKAKADEKSALRFFDEVMDRHVRERAQLERELRTAIANHDIRPEFQPLIELKSRQVVGFEALARWTHPSLGEIPPDRFIPIAEDSGLIQELSDQLLRQACQTARQWPDGVTLAFNISPVQLRDRQLGLRVLGILASTGLAPHRLEIEITESALVRDLDGAKEVLGALRDAGVRIALDDFGTGYSSLYHLRNFKIDKIKIDRSFVESMGAEEESSEIVSALVGLGRGLGLTITAEGIEDLAQEEDLLARGCELGQGHLFSRAVSGTDTAAFFPGSTAERGLSG
jgi:diguanylate cyclase (GGDEF)-like protein